MIVLEAGLLDSVQKVYDRNKGEIDENVLVELVERFFQRYSKSFILQEMILVMLEFAEELRQEPMKLLKTLRKLRQNEEVGSQYFSKIFSNQGSSSLINKINIGQNYFEIKENLLANLSVLYGIKSTSGKENSLKRSLVEMLRNRTSHSGKGSQAVLEELREVIREETHHGPSKMESGMSEYGFQVIIFF
jgi:hypothetical protein